jgi:hypothetical protein
MVKLFFPPLAIKNLFKFKIIVLEWILNSRINFFQQQANWYRLIAQPTKKERVLA